MRWPAGMTSRRRFARGLQILRSLWRGMRFAASKSMMWKWDRWWEASMSVKVVLPNAFQKHTNGTKEMESKAANLPQLIEEIEVSFPALKQHLRDGDGQVRRFINFYVNDEDI